MSTDSCDATAPLRAYVTILHRLAALPKTMDPDEAVACGSKLRLTLAGVAERPSTVQPYVAIPASLATADQAAQMTAIADMETVLKTISRLLTSCGSPATLIVEPGAYDRHRRAMTTEILGDIATLVATTLQRHGCAGRRAEAC